MKELASPPNKKYGVVDRSDRLALFTCLGFKAAQAEYKFWPAARVIGLLQHKCGLWGPQDPVYKNAQHLLHSRRKGQEEQLDV